MGDKRKYRYYKGVKVNSWGTPVFLMDLIKGNPRIKKDDRKRNYYNVTFPSIFSKNAPRNLLLMYDIPSDKRKERDWLRRHLRKFNYIMIQKSVWVGPSPLPKDFLVYLKEIKIGDSFKTFKLQKPYESMDNLKSK